MSGPGGAGPDEVVLVTGVGGPAGVSVLGELGRLGLATVGVDASPDAVGLRLADVGAVLPLAGDPAYLDALVALAGARGVTALVPTVAEELVALAAGAERLDRAGVAHWLPAPAATERCTDKWAFHQVAVEAGVPSRPPGWARPRACPGPGWSSRASAEARVRST